MNGQDTPARPPRGAVIVVAVGLLASLAAALLTNENLVGAAQLEWTATRSIPDSKPVALPDGSGSMRLAGGRLRATEPNIAGYKLFRVSSLVEIGAGAAVGRARLLCTTRVPERVIVAKTTQRRAAFPVSTSDEAKLQKQEVKDNLLLEFSAHGSDLALLEFADAFDAYTNLDGIKVEWPPFHPGREEWLWFLPPGRLAKPLRLGFASVWRTRQAPAASNSCTLTTASGTVSVRSAARLGTPDVAR